VFCNDLMVILMLHFIQLNLKRQNFIVDQNNFSQDYILGNKILIKQPKQGYRAGIDPIILAAAMQPNKGDTVLDIGTGVATAALCLATRINDIKITGIEQQRNLVRFATDNVRFNNFHDRIEIISGDLMSPPPRLSGGTFAHVMANPPYFEHEKTRPSPYESKAISNQEGSATLEQWLRFCLLMIKPKGTITFIYRAERIDELMSYFYNKLGDIKIMPLWPCYQKSAKLVLIKGVKGSYGKCELLRGLSLHQPNGYYTNEAEEILRNAKALNW
jgi:tRNA1(Val) A37 N6-methylase TrmN6